MSEDGQWNSDSQLVQFPSVNEGIVQKRVPQLFIMRTARLVSVDGALTAGANPQENSPTGKKTKMRKRICAFIMRKWRGFKSAILCSSRGNKVSPLWPQPHTDPSQLEQTDDQNPDEPQPAPSGLKNSDDSQPGSSNVEPATDPDPADPEPAKGPFHLLYDVGEILGAGSFGKVFKGTRICDGKQVAIKFVQKRAAERLLHTPDSPNPLFAEVALNVLLQKAPRSQHVLQMYEWFDEPKQRILILEHPQPCETLLEFVWRKGGRLDETLACGLMRQAVLGIRHCLDRGVHHNDIKMDNILVNTETLQLKLIDFGCGVLLKHAYEDNQGRLKPDTDALTVLSLGIMLYKMVNGLDTVIGDFDNLKCDVNMSKDLRHIWSDRLLFAPSI